MTPAVAALVALAGCATPHPWAPTTPQGATYVYGEATPLTVSALGVATSPHVSMHVAALDFQARGGVVESTEGAKDPFAEATPIDGRSFNAHLGGQGERVAPAERVEAPR
jgi:hypothetical protein